MEEIPIHGRKSLEYPLAVLRRYCERIEISDICHSSEAAEREIYRFLRIANNSPAGPPDGVLLHDSCRPLIKPESLEGIISALKNGNAVAAAATAVTDTILIESSPLEAEGGYLIQSPTGFLFPFLLEAHEWRLQMGRSFDSATSLMHSWRRISPFLVLQDSSSGRRLGSREDIAALEGVLKFGQPIGNSKCHDLCGINVLVLGGTGGIGRACIDLLTRLGASYYAPSRQELNLLHEQEFPGLSSFQHVIHAAGEYRGSTREIFDVNFFSCLNLLTAAERIKWKGNVVFLSSSSSTRGREGIPAYSASKAALNALVEAEADRLAAEGIIINVVAPAKVNTRLHNVMNPRLHRDAMLSPDYVARVVVRYLTIKSHGSVIFIREGTHEDMHD